MREVCIEGPIQGERRRVRIQRRVRLRLVLHCRPRKAREELVDISNALHGPERLSVARAVVLVQVTVVHDRSPRIEFLVYGAEVSWALMCDSVKRTESEQAVRVGIGQV